MGWDNKSVLVTGAGGFIGSHLTEGLVRRGAKVRAFVHYNSRADPGLLRFVDDEILDAVDIYFGEIKDPDSVRRAMNGVDVVFNLAALIGIPYSYVHPYDVVQTNLLGTLHVLLAARDFGIERLVQTSTSEVYGSAKYVPIDEDHPLQGQSPYSASKIGSDKLAESFYLSFGLPVSTVRPFNTYGPRQSARAVIPTIITQALTQDAIRLGSLTPRRDFTFARDTARGFILAAESEASVGEVVNLGNGQEITIGELAERIRHLVGRDIPILSDDDRVRPEASEVNRLLASNEKAARLIGWRPEVGFDQGLGETISWIADHLEVFQVGRYAV
ncbi:MAG: GDP-mannose 4,6-dehydratase [Anaerolineae bacterium]|nr:GDP-mannose 4,6-dehydratase [Anaerolineae bacterium]